MPVLNFLETDSSGDNQSKEKYRPSFLDHFEKKEVVDQKSQQTNEVSAALRKVVPAVQQQEPFGFNRSFADGDFEFVRIL